MSFICAIDVGTASARAGIFDLEGRLLGRESRPIVLWQEGGLSALSSANIIEAICEAVQAALAMARVEPREVAALGFDATCSLVLRNRAGGPLARNGRDTIPWFDHRALHEAAQIDKTGHKVLDYLGKTISPEMQTPKLLWLKQQRPELWQALGGAYDLADYLTFWATGSTRRSICTLAAKWTYLPDSGGWQQDFFDQIGLSDLREKAALPDTAAPVGEAIGTLAPEAAARLGLRAGIPVAAGMIDAYAGALGVLGASTDASPALAMIAGTSTCIMALSPDAWAAPGVWGPFDGAVLPGLHACEGGQSATGALLDHVMRINGLEPTGETHERIERHIRTCLAREGANYASGLHLLPDFNGNRSPFGDAMARGAIFGLTLERGFEAACRLYWRAAVALALGVRQIVEHMEAHGGPRAERLILTGGHGRSELLVQLYADVTGREVHLCHQPDAVLTGTAMAAAAAGPLGDIRAAAAAMSFGTRPYAPAPERHAAFARDYEIFLQLQSCRSAISAL